MLVEIPVETQAMRLLKLLYDARLKLKPVYIPDVAYELGIGKKEACASWEYLRDQKLIKTYALQYAATISEAGIEKVKSVAA